MIGQSDFRQALTSLDSGISSLEQAHSLLSYSDGHIILFKVLQSVFLPIHVVLEILGVLELSPASQHERIVVFHGPAF